MKAFLVLAFLCVAAVATTEHRVLRHRAASKLQHHLDLNLAHWLAPDYQYDYAQNILGAAKAAKCSLAAKDKSFQSVLAVRTNKFEAALAMAVQRNPATISSLKEMIEREICISSVAFLGLTPEEATEQHKDSDLRALIVSLFALPGSKEGTQPYNDEKAWTDFAKTLEERDAWSKPWIHLDNSRSGMWVENDVEKNLESLLAIRESNHYRELLHTLTRASLYGEDIKDVAELEKKAPHSLRHAIYSLLQNGDRAKKAAKECGFTAQPHKIKAAASGKEKKTYFCGSDKSVVPFARQKGAKTFRGLAHQTSGNKKGCHAYPTRVTPNALYRLGMPPITKREVNYFQKYYQFEADALAHKPAGRGRVDGFETGTKPVPWGYGSCVWDMNFFKDGDKITPLTYNKDWKESMEADGLAVDAGPSGTTDEILSVADWLGMTDNAYSFCAIRDVAFANMIIPEHHSMGEIIQGAFDGYRLAKSLPPFEFKDPYHTIVWCDQQPNDFTALFVSDAQDKHKLADSVKRFGTANRLIREKNPNVDGAWAILASETDYAQGMVVHEFRDSTLPAQDVADFEKCICSSLKPVESSTGADLTTCALKRVQVALRCPGDWEDKNCLGPSTPKLPADYFPTGKWEAK
jgi:hypothetical protein